MIRRFDLIYSTRQSRWTQRVAALIFIAVFFVAALIKGTTSPAILGAWFVPILAFPGVFGRMVGIVIGIVAALLIFLLEGGSGIAFRIDALPLALPMLFFAAIFGFGRFAEVIGLMVSGWVSSVMPGHNRP